MCSYIIIIAILYHAGPTTDPPLTTNSDTPVTPVNSGTPAIIAGIIVAGSSSVFTILVCILLVIMLCYNKRHITQAKTEIRREDSVDKTGGSESHIYEQIGNNIDQEYTHNTEAPVEGHIEQPAIALEDINIEAAGSEDVCPDAAVMTSPNQAYGCPVKKVDEGHTYTNVDLVEATTLFYTTSDGTRTYRPPEPATEVAAVSLSLEQPEVIPAVNVIPPAIEEEHNQTIAADPSDDMSPITTSPNQAYGCRWMKVIPTRMWI